MTLTTFTRARPLGNESTITALGSVPWGTVSTTVYSATSPIARFEPFVNDSDVLEMDFTMVTGRIAAWAES